jgi:SAM-dependent methyltransferase
MTEYDKQLLEKEFDFLADEYAKEHQKNIRISGETPDFFSEYKIRDLKALTKFQCFLPKTIFDFGSGIGNSIPFFRKYFKDSQLIASDVSSRSIEISKTRFPGQKKYLLINKSISITTESQDLIFSACVFHHIQHDQHIYWLKELYRVASLNSMIVIFEHNPLNPLTVYAVNTCPIDINAKLIRSGQLKKKLIDSGWSDIEISYKFFFPSFLRFLRPLENYLSWCCFGGQYLISGRKYKEKNPV